MYSGIFSSTNMFLTQPCVTSFKSSFYQSQQCTRHTSVNLRTWRRGLIYSVLPVYICTRPYTSWSFLRQAIYSSPVSGGCTKTLSSKPKSFASSGDMNRSRSILLSVETKPASPGYHWRSSNTSHCMNVILKGTASIKMREIDPSHVRD